MICILQFDLLDYSAGLRLQERLVTLRKAGDIGDVLLLLEHTPVITLGRNANAGNVIASPEVLAERGVELFETDRGGDVTFHGPGQLVGYPIFDLRGFPSADPKRCTLGAVDFIRSLEKVLIRTCADFGIVTKRVDTLTGVWTAPAQTLHGSAPVEAKVAAIGVHISRSVTSHGFALNVTTDLDYFKMIIPCGIGNRPVTSMAHELGRKISLQEVAHSVARNIGEVFQSPILWLENLDALLGESLGTPMRPPRELRKVHPQEEKFWA